MASLIGRGGPRRDVALGRLFPEIARQPVDDPAELGRRRKNTQFPVLQLDDDIEHLDKSLEIPRRACARRSVLRLVDETPCFRG